MPRYARREKTKRYQFDAQDTHDYTTPSLDVFAQPVDPYAKPADPEGAIRLLSKRSADTEAFLSTLENLQGALISGVKIKERLDKEQTEKGRRAAIKGEAAPEGASDAYLYGHELITGKAAAAELERALDEHYQANQDAPPEEFAKSQDQLIREFMSGRSEAFIDGITPDAIQLKREYRARHIKERTERVKLDGLSKLSIGVESDVRRIYGDITLSREDRAKMVREVITGAQDLAIASYGVDRPTVSDHMVGVLSRVAVDLGDVSVMDATKEVHAGVRMIDNPKLAPKIEAGIRAATAEERRRKQEIEQDKKAEMARVENEIQTIVMANLVDPNGDRKKAYELIYKYSDPSRNPLGVVLNPSIISAAYRLLEEGNSGFAKVTNYEVFDVVYDKFQRGDGSLADLQEVKRYVTEGKYNELRALLYKEGSRASRSPGRQEFDVRVIGTANKAAEAHVFAGKFDGNGKGRKAYIQDHAMSWWNEYKDAHGGKEPSVEEQRKKLIELEKEAYLQYPPKIFDMETGKQVTPDEGKSPPAATLGAPVGKNRNAPEDQTRRRALTALDRVRAKRAGKE